MLAAIIRWSSQNVLLVLMATIFAVAAGIYAVSRTPLDAIPDLSDPQVIVYTEYPGQAPQVVEDQVTYPLTTALLAVPRSQVVRGFSFFGVSFVYVVFDDGTDIYWARSRVLEYLNFAQKRLPNGVTSSLGPDATGVGFVKQYQVVVDPGKLRAYGIPLSAVIAAVRASNMDVGGRVIEMSEREYMVRGRGYLKGTQDLEQIALKSTNGTPVYLRDVARVELGPDERRGLTDLNGQGEVVSGIVLQRNGENALDVINNVKQKIAEIASSLPDGVRILSV